MQNPGLLFSIFRFAILSCGRTNSDSSLTNEELEEAIKNGDTTIFMKNGKRHIVVFNAALETIQHSINGRVIYAYNTDGGKHIYDRFGNVSKCVYKENLETEQYYVRINDDSLQVGEQFVGTCWLSNSDYTIKLTHPREDSIRVTNEDGLFRLELEADKPGEYTFAGEILQDSKTIVSFEYKYLVAARKSF